MRFRETSRRRHSPDRGSPLLSGADRVDSADDSLCLDSATVHRLNPPSASVQSPARKAWLGSRRACTVSAFLPVLSVTAAESNRDQPVDVLRVRERTARTQAGPPTETLTAKDTDKVECLGEKPECLAHGILCQPQLLGQIPAPHTATFKETARSGRGLPLNRISRAVALAFQSLP